MPYVESSLISRTGYGDDHFDADLRAAYKSHQGVNGLSDVGTFLTTPIGMVSAGVAAYFLFFRKKKGR